MFDFIYSEVFWMETAIMTGVAAIIGVCVSNRKLGSTVEKKRLELSSEHKDLFREHSGLSREHSGLSREHSDLSKDLTGISSEIGKISNTTYTIEKNVYRRKDKRTRQVRHIAEG